MSRFPVDASIRDIIRALEHLGFQLVRQANLSQPVRLNERAFLAALVLFLGYTAVWTVGLFRAFRVPDNGGLHG